MSDDSEVKSQDNIAIGTQWNNFIPKRVKMHPRGDEMRAIMERIRNGDEDAKKEMVERNMRLVTSLAYKIISRYGMNPNSPEAFDLVQEGCIGLLRAIDKFEYERGLEFSTYATWWIKQSITRGKDETIFTDMRRPVHYRIRARHMARTLSLFVKQYGRPAALTDYKELGVIMFDTFGCDWVTDKSIKQVQEEGYDKYRERMEDFIKENFMDGVVFIDNTAISFEAPLPHMDADNDMSIGDTLVKESEPTFLELVHNREQREMLAAIIGGFKERERIVVFCRFVAGMTLEETGALEEMNVTRERIRQIESMMLKRMRRAVNDYKNGEYVVTAKCDPDKLFDPTVGYKEAVATDAVAGISEAHARWLLPEDDEPLVDEANVADAEEQASKRMNAEPRRKGYDPISDNAVRLRVMTEIDAVVELNAKNPLDAMEMKRFLYALLLDGKPCATAGREVGVPQSKSYSWMTRWRKYRGQQPYISGIPPRPFETPEGYVKLSYTVDKGNGESTVYDSVESMMHARFMTEKQLEMYRNTDDFKEKQAFITKLNRRTNHLFDRPYSEASGFSFELREKGYHIKMIAALMGSKIGSINQIMSVRRSNYRGESYWDLRHEDIDVLRREYLAKTGA